MRKKIYKSFLFCLIGGFVTASFASTTNVEAVRSINEALVEVSKLRQSNPRNISLVRIENSLYDALASIQGGSTYLTETVSARYVAAINCRDPRSEPNNTYLKEVLMALRSVERNLLARCMAEGHPRCMARNITYDFQVRGFDCEVSGTLVI